MNWFFLLPRGLGERRRSARKRKRARRWRFGLCVELLEQRLCLAYLPAPPLYYPSNGSTGQSTTPAFSWSAVSGASSYRIMVARNATDLPTDPTASTGGSSVVFNDTPTGTLDSPSPALSAGTTYYWEVHGRSATQYGTWSSVFSFTTLPKDTTPPTVCISSPYNGQAFNTSPITVSGTATDAGGSGLQNVFVDDPTSNSYGTEFLSGNSASFSVSGISLVQGSNFIVVQAYDNAGNSSTVAMLTVIYDTTLPTVTISSPYNGQTFNTSPITVSGTATDAGGSGLQNVFVDDPTSNSYGTELLSGNSASFSVSGISLVQGSNFIVVQAYDNAGNSSTVAMLTVIYDTTLPTVTISSPYNGQTFNTSPITVSGTATDAGGSGLQNVFVDDPTSNSYGTELLSGNSASFSVSGISLVQGSNFIVVQAYDNAGNSSTVAMLTVIYDTTLPTVTISSPYNGQTFNTSPITVSGTATDAGGSGLQNVFVDDPTSNSYGTELLSGNSASFSVSGISLVQGSNFIVVQAYDNAGNSSTVAMLTVIYDTTLPTVTISSPYNGQTFNTSPITVSGTATDAGGSGLQNVFVDDPTSNSYGTELLSGNSASFSVSGISLVQGSNFIVVQAYDNAGNSSTVAMLTVIYDTTLPTVTISSPYNGQTFNTSPITVSGTATDAGGSGLQNVFVDDPTSNSYGTELLSGNSASFSVSGISLVQGSNFIVVQAYDNAGNSSTVAMLTVIYDTTLPTVTISSPYNGQTFNTSPITVSGTATDAGGSGLQNVFVDDPTSNSYGTELLSGNSASFSVSGISLVQGSNFIVVQAYDNAGNSSTVAMLTVIYDTTLPTVTISSPYNGQTFNTSPITVSGTATDAGGSGLQNVFVDDPTSNSYGTELLSGNSASFSVSGISLVQGSNFIVVQAYDNAGNSSTVAMLTVTYAAALPAWTVLVYMDGDNNLEPWDVGDVQQMEQVGSTGNVNVIVQFDRGSQAIQDLNGNYNLSWYGCRCAEITKDPNDDGLASFSSSASMGQVDMGNPTTLTDFIQCGVQQYPANHYLLVIGNHGGGIDGACEDYTSGTILSVKDIGQAIAAAGTHIDVLSFDACLMDMEEVAHQIQPYASVFVASEDEMYASTWPYEKILADMGTSPAMTPVQLGDDIVNEYGQYFGGVNGSCQTMAAIDLAKEPALASSLDTFARVATGFAEWTTISNARNVAANYPLFDAENRPRDFLDLGSLLQYVKNNAVHPILGTAASTAYSAYQAAILDNYSSSLDGGTGLSIYLPTDPTKLSAKNYTAANFSFVHDTCWASFLTAYVNNAPPVTKASTTTAVSSSPNPLVYGQSVTFTTMVTPGSGTFDNGGTVQFAVDGSNFGVPVSLSGGSATIADAVLSGGTHTITATYSGDRNFSTSSGTLSGGQTVNKVTTTMAVSSSPNPLVFGQSVTFTAVVSPLYGGTATGTVTFSDGSTSIGTASVSGNVATLTDPATVISGFGTHTITAYYSGNTNVIGGSAFEQRPANGQPGQHDDGPVLHFDQCVVLRSIGHLHGHGERQPPRHGGRPNRHSHL